MKKEMVEALFTLAGFEVKHMHKLQNPYWPEVPNYYDLIIDNPWWLVMTQYGYIKIGPRKRVVSIEWNETAYRGIITEDDVTKADALVYSYSQTDSLKYLTELATRLAAL